MWDRNKREISDERKIFVSDDGTHYVYKRDTEMRLNISTADNQDMREKSLIDDLADHASFKASFT